MRPGKSFSYCAWTWDMGWYGTALKILCLYQLCNLRPGIHTDCEWVLPIQLSHTARQAWRKKIEHIKYSTHVPYIQNLRLVTDREAYEGLSRREDHGFLCTCHHRFSMLHRLHSLRTICLHRGKGVWSSQNFYSVQTRPFRTFEAHHDLRLLHPEPRGT